MPRLPHLSGREIANALQRLGFEVARELHKLETPFFTGNTKHQRLRGLAPFYAAIRKAARDIGTHHEKQTFLKSVCENQDEVGNPKAADRPGTKYSTQHSK